jgi:hypothetical protein
MVGIPKIVSSVVLEPLPSPFVRMLDTVSASIKLVKSQYLKAFYRRVSNT